MLVVDSGDEVEATDDGAASGAAVVEAAVVDANAGAEPPLVTDVLTACWPALFYDEVELEQPANTRTTAAPASGTATDLAPIMDPSVRFCLSIALTRNRPVGYVSRCRFSGSRRHRLGD